ncbi:signal peptidase II [bacterium]|nr:signal peptidase II [bacterium]
MKKIILILFIFSADRLSKIYLLNLQSSGVDIDFYIFSFLNFYLIWNSGIGFGLASMEANIYYHILTTIIVFVNIGLIYFLVKSKGINGYMIALIIGGSLGNLFDRVYYYAVPDFIDLHLGSYHWFVFNIADIFITVGIIGLMLIEVLKKEKISKNV